MTDDTIIDNTATGYTTQQYSEDRYIQSLKITNKTGGTVTLNVQLFNGTAHINISPKDVQLLPSTSYNDYGIVLKAGNYFLFTVNGSCDYYIDISPAL